MFIHLENKNHVPSGDGEINIVKTKQNRVKYTYLLCVPMQWVELQNNKSKIFFLVLASHELVFPSVADCCVVYPLRFGLCASSGVFGFFFALTVTVLLVGFHGFLPTGC